MATKKQFFDFSTREDIIPVIKVTELPEVSSRTIAVDDDFDTAMAKVNSIKTDLEWKTPVNIHIVDPSTPDIEPTPSNPPFNP